MLGLKTDESCTLIRFWEFPMKHKHGKHSVIESVCSSAMQSHTYLHTWWTFAAVTAVIHCISVTIKGFDMETMTATQSTLNRMKTLRRTLSLNIKPKHDIKETTSNCNKEFDFVNFDNRLSVEPGLMTEIMLDSGHYEYVTSSPPGPDKNIDKNATQVKTKRGALWQMSGKLFSTWQEKFCVLTENSFYSFSKKVGSMTKTFTKIRLLDICDILLETEKGQRILKIKTRMGKLMFRRSEEIEDWHQQFLVNISALRRNNLMRSLTMETTCVKQRRPLMGVSSLKPNIYDH